MKKIVVLALWLTSCSSVHSVTAPLDALTYHISIEEAKTFKEEYNNLNISNIIDYKDFIEIRKKTDLKDIEKIKKEWDKCNTITEKHKVCHGASFDTYAKLHINFKELNINQILATNCAQYIAGYSEFESCFNREKEQLEEYLISVKEAEISEKKFQQSKKEEEKRFGYKFCDDDSVIANPLHVVVPMNCMHVRKGEKVMQQLADGTLVSGGDGIYIPIYIFFIEKNDIDDKLLDNQALPWGYFVRTGNYTYRSILGAKKTIMKVKRVGY